jgi:hypothetical protein
LWLISGTHSIYCTIPSKISTNVEDVEDVVDANNGRGMSGVVISGGVMSQQPVGEFHPARWENKEE